MDGRDRIIEEVRALVAKQAAQRAEVRENVVEVLHGKIVVGTAP